MLITAFVALIIGISLIGVVATQEQGYTTKTGILNESQTTTCIASGTIGSVNYTTSYQITNEPTTWMTDSSDNTCYTTMVELRAGNGTVLVEDTDYTFTDRWGNFTLINTLATNSSICGSTVAASNKTMIDYDYCGTDYLVQSWQRSVLDLVPGFFGLALLLISVGLFYNIARREGILDQI